MITTLITELHGRDWQLILYLAGVLADLLSFVSPYNVVFLVARTKSLP